MKKFLSVYCIAIITLFCSCYRQAFFLSPFNAVSNTYHAKPLLADSIKAASYAGGIITLGGANEHWEDDVFSLRGDFYRVHSFNSMQAYYGASFTLGNYQVQPDKLYINNNINPAIINERSGHKFFGGYGISGGINTVLVTGPASEWKVIGIDFNLQNEFGSYFSFRKNLPDSAATAITKKRLFITLGLNSELSVSLRNGGRMGYVISGGTALQKTKRFFVSGQKVDIVPRYFSNTFYYEKNIWTGFAQINVGTCAGNFQFGLTMRLGKHK
jgi:hypothetical protein